jgi:ADP-heptose:LPS heptosyltransferase
MKQVTLQRFNGLGDVCMALCASKAAAKAGYEVRFHTHPAFHALASSCPWVSEVTSASGKLPMIDLSTALPTRRVVDLSPALHGIQPYHEVDSFCHKIGLGAVSPENKSLDLNTEGIVAKKLPRFAILHPGTTDPNRTMAPKFWDALVGFLSYAQVPVAIIGKSKNNDNRSVYRPKGDYLDLVNKLTFLQTVALFKANPTSVLVSADSGPIQLAGASNIGIVGIYSVVKGSNRLPYRRGGPGWKAIAIESDCPHFPCYGRMNDRNLRENLDQGMTLGQIFSNWCPAEDFHCMKNPPIAPILTAIMNLLEVNRNA